MAGAAVTPATPVEVSVVAAARIRVQASGPGTFYTVSISVTAMSDVQIDRVDCFLQGTRILTPNGEMAVEALPTGDAVLTQSGAVQPILWTGHRTLDTSLLTAHPEIGPVLQCPRTGARQRDTSC
jgi:hypothetical protein